MYYTIARFLEILDFGIIIGWVFGFLIPFKYTRTRITHLGLTWTVFFAQIICGMNCPLLIWANQCRIASGRGSIATRFQPTFLNMLATVTGHQAANALMVISILVGPLIATTIFYLKKKEVVEEIAS